MLYFDADPRDGAPAGGVCNACCCEPIFMRPGETNLITINYAPWSLPIGNPGIVKGTEYSVEMNCSACSSAAVDGFSVPSNTNYDLPVVADTPLAIDLSTNAAPAGNTFTYAVIPLQGPTHGTVDQTGSAGAPTFTYTPNTGFTGYDYFSYKMTDAQGREVTRTVQLNVGMHLNAPNRQLMASLPFISPGAISVDRTMQTVRFPLYMPLSARDCEKYTLTIKQPAQDCECNTYNHFMCFDIRTGNC